MKINWWKKTLSYLMDIRLESTDSPYNEELHVILSKGRFQLCTPSAIYSYGDKYDNFKGVFENILLPKKKINVLVLGLGLGSIPYMLEKIFHKEYVYTFVEIDEEVIHLANKYTLNDLRSDFNVIQTDAAVFAQLNQTKFDLIAMDVFDSDVIPEAFEEQGFLQNINRALSNDGLLIYNRLYLSDKDKTLTDTFYNKTFKRIFPEATFITTPYNKMLLSNNAYKK